MARFSRIYVIPICGIICPLYIIYYYISVRTDLYGGRIFHFILRTSILRCGFIANYGFARRICIEFYSLLVFIGVRTLIRRTGSSVKNQIRWNASRLSSRRFPVCACTHRMSCGGFRHRSLHAGEIVPD